MPRLLTVLVILLCASLAPLGAVADPPSAVDAARAKVVAGDAAGAIHDLTAYVPAHRDDVAAARFLGDLYFRVPDYPKAEAVWRAIVSRSPNDRETHNRLGSLYAVQDRVVDAIAEFERSLPSAGGFVGLVRQHQRIGDLRQYDALLKTRAEGAPNDSEAQWYYANVLRVERKYDAAQSFFDRVVMLNPGNCGALIDAGSNAIDLARYGDALGYLERCLKLEPANYAANVDEGEVYLEKNELARARPYFERALHVNPNGAEALVDRGYIEDAHNQWKDAVGDYVRAMAADPLQSAAYVDLGYDYNEHQLYQLAEATFIKGLSVANDQGRLHYMLAVTYNVQGKVALAREQYRLAIAAGDEALVVRAAQAELALLPP